MSLRDYILKNGWIWVFDYFDFFFLQHKSLSMTRDVVSHSFPRLTSKQDPQRRCRIFCPLPPRQVSLLRNDRDMISQSVGFLLYYLYRTTGWKKRRAFRSPCGNRVQVPSL